MFGINFAETTHSEGIEQMTRTVNYSTRVVDEDALFADFDNHTFEKTDDEVNIVAKKSYSKSLFEELDLYSSYIKYVNDTNEDWKYWSMSKSNYEYFNGMKCYKATLSF